MISRMKKTSIFGQNFYQKTRYLYGMPNSNCSNIKTYAVSGIHHSINKPEQLNQDYC